MPTKNRLDLLQRAVTSVLTQSYLDWELLIINDGSTDGTREYLDGLTTRDSRVKAIHNPESKGAPHSRNLAIRAAKGEFVTGLDDDDWFHPNRLAAHLAYWKILEESGEAFSCIYAQEVYVNGEQRETSRKACAVSADDLYFHNFIGNQIFARKEAYIKSGLFDESMPAWQDLDMFIRLLSTCGPARLLDSALYFTSLDDRPDRISVGSKAKILSAYRRLVAKHPTISSAARQGLYLQAFGPLYTNTPGIRDLAEFFRHGLHAKNIARLLKVYGRQYSKSKHWAGRAPRQDIPQPGQPPE